MHSQEMKQQNNTDNYVLKFTIIHFSISGLISSENEKINVSKQSILKNLNSDGPRVYESQISKGLIL